MASVMALEVAIPKSCNTIICSILQMLNHAMKAVKNKSTFRDTEILLANGDAVYFRELMQATL